MTADEQVAASHVYTLRRSPRRRRTIELSLDARGELIVAAPMRTPRREIEAFVRRKARWIEKTRSAAHERAAHVRRDFVSGDTLPYLGQALELQVTDDEAAVERLGSALDVRMPAQTDDSSRRGQIIEVIEGWYRQQALAIFAERIEVFAPLLGVRPAGVRVRDQKTRWGSCGRDGTLYFGWRLVMAPLAIIDYLVVHELCHLRQRGHGRRFWALVEKVLPDHQGRRAELRREGWRYRLW
jgi:predicted metal-dependent hydrolase